MASQVGLARQAGFYLDLSTSNFSRRGRSWSWRVVGTSGRIRKAVTLSSQVSEQVARSSAGGNDGKDYNQGCFKHAMDLIARAEVLPKLVVLDLDYTIWPFYCYTSQYQTSLTDTPAVYPDAVDIIKALAASRITLAVASRTPALAIAMDFMEKLSIVEYFSYLEIYFTVFAKTSHFNALKEKAGVPYKSMLFFDDETKNVDAARKLGVNTVMVNEGLNLKALEDGLNLLTPNSSGPATENSAESREGCS
ncbi:hypothetical protein R1flu_007725 [Riccia fluitans]|uniref:Magnesium-dependent phosphatase 1 n=1 Tax=Riccia fluitans TaxID=41844 RepID=A0ABD1Z072_9MARC